MTELTEDEHRLLDYAVNATDCGFVDVVETVERIIDARLAPVRALADEWADADGEPVSTDGLLTLTVTNQLGKRLRAALSAHESAPQADDGAGSHGDDERAASSVQRVHNHPPYRPPCNERAVDGQLRGACLNDDGSTR